MCRCGLYPSLIIYRLFLIDGAEKLSDSNRDKLYKKCKRKKVSNLLTTRTTNDSGIRSEVPYNAYIRKLFQPGESNEILRFIPIQIFCKMRSWGHGRNHRGKYEREKTSALLVGSYVDAHFEGTLDVFQAQNPSIFTKQGSLKSEYRRAEEIIQRLERDEFHEIWQENKQSWLVNYSASPWKIKIDSYLEGGHC